MSAHFSSRVTNFEFVKNVRESGFSFKSYKECVDLSRIAHLDLDRVARDLDISVLQEHVGTLVNCDLSDLKGVDPGLLKLLRLAQLCVDYCIFCQDFLESSLTTLENAHEATLKELETTKKENRSLKEKLKKDNKRKRFLSEQKENIIDPFYECSQCKKAYSSLEYLQSHVQRRHSSGEIEIDKSNEMLQELKSDIEMLRRELVKEKETALVNFQENKTEMQLKREEAMWSQIEKSQAEQRARHQSEIADLTSNFQLQLKQALADLATNLSKSEVHVSKFSEEPQVQSGPNIHEIQMIKEEMNELWQKKLDQQENWFRMENSKLMEQLQKMQERDERRWSELKSLQTQPKPLPPAQIETEDEKPVPAARRKRLQPQTTSSTSKLEFKEFAPAPLEEATESSDTSSAQELCQEAPTAPTNLVVCTPKTIPPRPKSALAFEEQSAEESASEDDEISERSDDIETTLRDMKEAIEQNPVLIESLKNEVENQVLEKMSEVGLLDAEDGMNRSEFLSVSNQMKEQRKLSEKQFHGFWKIRKNIEKKVDKKAKEQMAEICNESNLKPSKLKQHPGFFAKLTKRYNNKKGNKSKSDDQMFTSTPLKETENVEEPHSILKTRKSNLRMSSEVLSEKKEHQSVNNAEMRRAQSLPSSKFVSFTSKDEENKENDSWDEDTTAKTATAPKEGVKKIGQGNFNPFIVSSAPSIDLDDLEKELSSFQIPMSNLKSKVNANTSAKADLSLPLSDDNSWDLEEI